MNDRQTCTKENPYDPNEDSGRWAHPDAKEISQLDGYPGGDIVKYECPNCGITFKTELPQ